MIRLSPIEAQGYAQVPRLLKDKVKEVLIDSGMEELAKEEVQEK